jgi:predicted metal-dependent hydrolase
VLDSYKIKYKDYEIVLKIIRSKRKSISIEFRLKEGIKVRIPARMSDKALADFLYDNEKVIIKKYEESLKQQAQYLVEPLENIYVNGSKLPYLSETVTLEITSEIKMTPQKKIKDLNKTAYVYFMEDDLKGKILRIETFVSDIKFLRECVANRYKDQAKEIFKSKVQKYALVMKVHYKNITVKEQKTRWGSCSSIGNLNFNWKLIMMPEAIIDYVVVHELSHLLFMNHSKEFWKEVEIVLPDYKSRKNWLTKNGLQFQKY